MNREAPARRVLAGLIAANAVLLVGVVTTGAMLAFLDPFAPDPYLPAVRSDPRDGRNAVLIGLALLAATEVLALMLVLALRRRNGPDPHRMVAGVAGLDWVLAGPSAGGMLVAGAFLQGFHPTDGVNVLLVALLAGSALVSLGQAVWVVAWLARCPRTGTRAALAPRSGGTARRVLAAGAQWAGGWSVGAVALLVATVLLEPRDGRLLVHVAAAGSTALLGVGLVRAALLARGAIDGDAVELGAVDRAGSVLRGAAAAGVVAALLVVLGVAVGHETKGLGAAAPILLVPLLVAAAMQCGALSGLRVGQAGKRPTRWPLPLDRSPAG